MRKNYKKYSIQERKYSSNVIIGHYEEKDKEYTDIVLMSGITNKKESDIFMVEVCNYMNHLLFLIEQPIIIRITELS